MLSSEAASSSVGQAVVSVEPHFEADFAGEPSNVAMECQQNTFSNDVLVTSQALIPQSFSASRVDSSSDLASVVESCLRLLSEAPWPSSQGARPRVTSSDHKQSGYWNLGVRVSDRSSLTAVTRSLRSVVQELNLLLRQCWPQGTWNTICVSRNCFSAPHQDLANAAGSRNFLLSLGSFQNGELWLEDPAGDVPMFIPKLGHSLLGRLIDAHAKPFEFDPMRWHGSTQWQGDRWVLIAYSLPSVMRETLDGLHFPLHPLHLDVSVAGCSSPAASIPPAMPVHSFSMPGDAKLFLDLCSGASSPLASAALCHGIPALPIDILLDSTHDLLQDCTFERLLRLAFAGRFAFAHASPPCTEYSRLKLRPGPDHRPCRSEEHLQGLPENDAAANLRVVRSRTILERCVQILLAVYQSGGHCDLEQPRNALSWLEPAVQGYMLEVAADLVVVAACAYGCDMPKHWLFASSWRQIQSLASVCAHAEGTHSPIHGCDSDGNFRSRQSAQFPAPLCKAFVCAIQCLFDVGQPLQACTLLQALESLPSRPLESFPRATQDGAGIYSYPDWSVPPSGVSDVFKPLRQQLHDFFRQCKAPSRLRQAVAEQCKDPLFTQSEVAHMRRMWQQWSASLGHPGSFDWSIAPGQPYAIEALAHLASLLGDKDVTLWESLRRGVPTGVHQNIPLSNCFIPYVQSESWEPDMDFKICSGNWPGATANPELLMALLQAELDAGYVIEMPSLEAARARWPRVAIGKANVIVSENRSPRLIIDPSVSGVNGAALIPERYMLPGFGDIRLAFPVRGCKDEVGGFSLDISAAHKTVRIAAEEQGLLGIEANGRFFFYVVAPFGGNFSALWWQRVAGFLIRTSHRLVFCSHVLLMYVDDALFWQSLRAVPLNACLLLSFCQVFGYPVSWKKVQLGVEIEYIGWRINFRAGGFYLPQTKVTKLLHAIQAVLLGSECQVRDLERLIGLLHWILQMAPELRPWLCSLYHVKARPLATNFSLPLPIWQQMRTYVDTDLQFKLTPPGTSIKPGSRLLSVRHVEISSLDDLSKVRVTGKRLWARISDPSTGKRRLCATSKLFLSFWQQWCLRPQFYRPLEMPRWSPEVELAADACAHADAVGIGGWVRFGSQCPLWFSELFRVQDFLDLGLPMDPSANLDIVSYETLAQIALVLVFSSACVGGRMRISIPSWTDNSGTEAVCNKLFTTVMPLALFVQRLATIAWQSAVTLDTSHIAGEHNKLADLLSRWDGSSQLPDAFQPEFRLRCPLAFLWDGERDVRLWPPNASLLWQPPVSCLHAA